MADYVITGRAPGARAYLPPYNLITDQMSVGQTVTLTLSADDEATLIAAGIIIPADWAAGHLYPT